MRTTLAAAALAIFAATPALAQPGYTAPPPGSYQRQCSNIQMNGQFLSATCRGAHGAGPSSINVQSCSTGIFVDDSGALSCIGPGGGAPPQVRDAPAGYNTGQGQAYGRGSASPGYASPGYDSRGDRGRQDQGAGAQLFAQRSWRGQPAQVWGPTPDLGRAGLDGRVRSIEIDRRSGPWQLCSRPGYRGRCVTVRDSVSDTRALGLGDQIASLRPAR